jgi:hypothetical protein
VLKWKLKPNKLAKLSPRIAQIRNNDNKKVLSIHLPTCPNQAKKAALKKNK